MNYTKGEWKLEIVDASLPKHHKVYARIIPSVAYCGWKDMGVYDDPGIGKRSLKTLSEEALANANLIAAAPDMYEALRETIKIIELALNKGTFYPKLNRQVLRALAKAEGKERNER